MLSVCYLTDSWLVNDFLHKDLASVATEFPCTLCTYNVESTEWFIVWQPWFDLKDFSILGFSVSSHACLFIQN